MVGAAKYRRANDLIGATVTAGSGVYSMHCIGLREGLYEYEPVKGMIKPDV